MRGGGPLAARSPRRSAERFWAEPYVEPVILEKPTGKAFTDESARSEIAVQIASLVERHGCMHLDEVVRALRQAWGIQRMSGRSRAAFEAAVRLATRRADWLLHDSEFLIDLRWTPVVRVPSDGEAPVRVVREIAPIELDLALLRLLGDAGAADAEGLRQAWARLFGWRRTTPEIEASFEQAVRRLRAEGKLVGDEVLRPG